MAITPKNYIDKMICADMNFSEFDSVPKQNMGKGG